MSTNLPGTAVSARSLAIPPAYLEPEDQERSPLIQEYLPFTIRRVSNQADMNKAIDLRHLAYSRHMPGFADALKVPEQDDLSEDAVVLIAESKLDGSVIGTVRIQTNLTAPLNMEQSIRLPDFFKGKTLAEVRRLAVAPGNPGRLVKMVLLKAVYQYCQTNHLAWILVAARRPLDRTYEQLTLADVLDGRTFIPLPRENNVPHRVLGLETAAFHDRLVAVKHPLLNFFFHTEHPDIHPDCLVHGLMTSMMRGNTSTSIQQPGGRA
jgi:hypothetical protein